VVAGGVGGLTLSIFIVWEGRHLRRASEPQLVARSTEYVPILNRRRVARYPRLHIANLPAGRYRRFNRVASLAASRAPRAPPADCPRAEAILLRPGVVSSDCRRLLASQARCHPAGRAPMSSALFCVSAGPMNIGFDAVGVGLGPAPGPTPNPARRHYA